MLLRRVRDAGLVSVAAWLLAALGLDLYGYEDTPDGTYDQIIVAGCRVMPDGRPSLALARRATKAVDLWRAGVAPVIVFTGGGAPSEATVAAEHARGLGLPEAAIRIEDSSTSTAENALFAARRYPADRVVVVSDTYHIFRVERVFSPHYGELRGVGSRPRLWWRIRGAIREVAAVSWYAVTGRLRTEDRRQ